MPRLKKQYYVIEQAPPMEGPLDENELIEHLKSIGPYANEALVLRGDIVKPRIIEYTVYDVTIPSTTRRRTTRKVTA